MEPVPAVSKLLRLKRYEQPAPGYHEKFLYEFRRRQRAELLKRHPLAVFWENLCDIWPTYQVPRLAYAAIAAVAIGAGVLLFDDNRGSDPGQASFARAELNSIPDFSIEPSRPVTILNSVPVSTRADSSQHYVLQPRPASNDRPLSF